MKLTIDKCNQIASNLHLIIDKPAEFYDQVISYKRGRIITGLQAYNILMLRLCYESKVYSGCDFYQVCRCMLFGIARIPKSIVNGVVYDKPHTKKYTKPIAVGTDNLEGLK